MDFESRTSNVCNSNKRRRTCSNASEERSLTNNSSDQQHEQHQTKSVCELLKSREWAAATQRVILNPKEAVSTSDPSPLALACRLGAPFECVQAFLDACPSRLRHLLDSRGTPLHEAIVCDDVGPEIIKLLLKADEMLGTDTTRATLLQDVDGYTPLHLLIRRRFQSHVLGADEGSHLMEMLEMLVKSCAEAVVVPDRGEYEEPPIVMALKANVYAPLLQSEDSTAARIERNIFEMVHCMLQHYPPAASCVFTGYRGQYTALHSAVFHGRCPDTIELLLNTERRCPASQKAALLGNTQGELPLHFCAMRGEPPRSVALLAEAAPEAVLKRDASGLTPLHWLWIRFVSNLLALDDGGRGSTITMPLEPAVNLSDVSDYDAFTSLEQGDFEADLQLIRRLDPSVDFLRMRHIPIEVLEDADALQWAERTAQLLNNIRQRYRSSVVPTASNDLSQGGNNDDDDGTGNNDDEVGDDGTASHNVERQQQPQQQGIVVWTRIEAVTSLFWTKTVSLLKAAANAMAANDSSHRHGTNHSIQQEFSLVHTAFSAPCCLPPVARIVALLFPNELVRQDSKGRVPLHYAASRHWHAWDWPREDGTSESANARLLRRESVAVLTTAMNLSPPQVGSIYDHEQCLPLHHVIATFAHACSLSGRSCTVAPVEDMLAIVQQLVQMNPDALQEPDPKTSLFPFLQVPAVTTELVHHPSPGFPVPFPEEFPLSLCFQLLRDDPSLVKAAATLD